MLPHGGQSHNTFDKSFPRDKDISFDNALDRNIYYNQFDGFTSRSNVGITEIEKYFSKLGINSFVNLITCTDNYYSDKYTSAKSSKDEFIPNWINSKSNFQGLRLALFEKTRLLFIELSSQVKKYIEMIECYYKLNRGQYYVYIRKVEIKKINKKII